MGLEESNKDGAFFLIICCHNYRSIVLLILILYNGDLNVDSHHTMEDVGWALGRAINDALGNKRVLKDTVISIYQWTNV